ncbi:ABC-F family ATP-binding cassette domain-containing protein [Humitalea sp. 24SJ18S-53]|uniref:ABC-F family ATP-binding cassette domain-containing protein n=1 Tax=Humitalea sp. 24SJ18S-53 TaxID=3422307 RepID=UPI003D67308C
MTVLALRDVTLRIAGRPLLDAASMTLDPGRKIGLVGRNGAGKSTMLKAIAGELQLDGGEIFIASRARMGRVKQEAPASDDNLLETVLAADTERAALMQEAEISHDPTRLGEIHDRLIAIGADAAPSRAAMVLAGLGFDAAAQQRSVREFSGGWRMRLSLAGALFQEPDLLLLDEPTNHLDLEATIWLEAWLAKFSGACIVVSHDRGLLERCVDQIAHLDRGKITTYAGNFSEFVRLRAERAIHQAAQNARITAERAHMQDFVDRFRAKASKARQAQSRLKALEKMPQVESLVEDHVTRFSFPEPDKAPPPILSLRRAVAGYGNNVILSGLDFRLDQDDRIALLGANGNGKSTFAKLIAGRMEPLSGDVVRAPRLKIGYFAQHQAEELHPDGTPLTHMQEALPKATVQQCRAQLARFGLDAERVNTKIRDCSGGEKARLLLSLTTREAPHLLILDEPTNHLDIDAREALVKALADYGGAVILISHDPYLVGLVADRLWLVGNGTVTPFEGDLDDYRAQLGDRTRPAAKSDSNKNEERRGKATVRAAAAPLRARAKEIEARLERLGLEGKLIEKRLSDPATYAKHSPADIAWAKRKQASIAKEAAGLEEEWLEVQAKLEPA